MLPVNGSRMFVRSAHGWMLVALFLVSPGFVMPMLPTIQTTTKSAMPQGAVPSSASFVPDLQRRQLMNVVLVTTAAIPLFVALGAYLWYFVPPVATGASGAQLCGDLDGMPISYTSWVKKHKANDRELVQGLKGEPYYIISTEESIKDFALLSVCTHLGCVVPWDKAKNKFCCPCHGSQYDEGWTAIWHYPHGRSRISEQKRIRGGSKQRKQTETATSLCRRPMIVAFRCFSQAFLVAG